MTSGSLHQKGSRPLKIASVVLNYNSAGDTIACLRSLRAAAGSCRTWIVDNGSSDGSPDSIRVALEANETLLELGSNTGYSAGNNAGIGEALSWGADFVLVLNPDCRMEPGFLQPLQDALENSGRAGVACPLVLQSATGLVQALGGDFNLWTGSAKRRLYGKPLSAAQSRPDETVDFPHGACMLVKRECFEDAGLLPGEFFLYYDDVEFGLRVRRRGWDVVAIPRSRVYHADTTGRRIGNPLVAFYAGRNQAWVERMYANAMQYAVFIALSASLRWPVHFMASLWKGGAAVAMATAKGHLHGMFGRCPRYGSEKPAIHGQ